jgi:hypothetical protein
MPLGFEPRAFFCFQLEPGFRASENVLHEGHGFSRAVQSRNDEGFSVWATPFAASQPVHLIAKARRADR